MYKVYFSHAIKECRQDNTFDSGMFLLTKKEFRKKNKTSTVHLLAINTTKFTFLYFINCYIFFSFLETLLTLLVVSVIVNIVLVAAGLIYFLCWNRLLNVVRYVMQTI